MQRRVMTRSQVSKARQQGCCEPLLGGDSPPMRKRAPSNEHESRAEGSAPRDRISKTGTPTHAPSDTGNQSQPHTALPMPATFHSRQIASSTPRAIWGAALQVTKHLMGAPACSHTFTVCWGIFLSTTSARTLQCKQRLSGTSASIAHMDI